MGRTSSSLKRIAIPSRVASRISSWPEVSTASMTRSPSSTPRAMIPEGRGFEKAESSVFLTIPLRVASSTWPTSSKSRTEQTAAIFSPVWS